ncbi:MAG: hypothetical protein ABJZ55_00430 [Fuerstiella sp.]
MGSVAIALENLTRINATHMILGASTTPTNWPWLRKLKNRWKLSWQNSKRRQGKLAPIYVHPESEIEALVVKLKWRITEKHEIFNDGERVNYFYMLERT